MERKTYPSDLNNTEWEILEPLIPPPKPDGRPRSVNMREILSEGETILVLSRGKPKAIIKPVSEEILDFDDVSYLYHRPYN